MTLVGRIEILKSKNPSLENKEKIASQVGIGAVIFHYLKNNKIKDVIFDLDEVLARIEVNIRRSKEIQISNKNEGIFKHKEITLNSNTREVYVNDTLLNVTLREFEIFSLLIKYPNKVFSKDNIFKSVWGENYINDDNTIIVHISNIRNKLGKAGAKNDYIKTIWGIGYKLEV